MAVTINGDGTISGVSVGGLPDGVVDSGTLATNSVDSAELIDGAIDSGHLASGVGGRILQHKVHTASNPLEYNNSMTTTTELWSTTFTPTANDSKVLINVHWKAAHQDSSDGYWFGGLYRGASQIYIYGEAVSWSVAQNVGQYPSFWHMDSPATTNAVTYKMMPYYGVSYSSSHFYITRMRAVFFELAPN